MGKHRSSTTNWSMLSPLKRAVRKIKVLLHINIHRWRLASIIGGASSRRMLSFSDRPAGLRAACSEEDEDDDEALETRSSQDFSGSWRGLHRTMSFPAASEEDVDNKAEMFISNFYRQLQMERQVSLQLRYCRGNSFD